MICVSLFHFWMQAVSTSEAAVSLLLSPLSLYSWLTYTLFTLILSVPTLFLTSLYHSLLLLLAWPWCAVNVCASFILTCLHVALYLLLLALAVGLVVVFSLTLLAVGDTNNEKVLYQQKIVEIRHTKTRLRMFARRILQRG